MKNEIILYSPFKEIKLENRYLPPALLKNVIKANNYKYSILGQSFENRDLYFLTKGQGEKRILLWSQMHGNESTPTRAMLDVWKFLHSNHPWAKQITEKLTIEYIPQLNPDGAAYYTRRNACGIDLNRDFLHNQSTELIYLKNKVAEHHYKFLFNLHDQRSIFHPKGVNHPATISLLAPSVDEDRKLNETREKAMKLIVSMSEGAKAWLPQGIARFTDEFYPKATGDNFMKLNHPTILLECGHYPQDYERNKTREFTFYTLIYALKAIAEDDWQKNSIDEYKNIPVNDNKAFDVIFRQVKIKNKYHESVLDLGIIYKEKLIDNKIEFFAEIAEIGDLSDCFGHTEFNAQGASFYTKDNQLPALQMAADFNLGKDILVSNGKVVNL